jgi:hypothetical protein
MGQRAGRLAVSKVCSTVILHAKDTRTLTFENAYDILHMHYKLHISHTFHVTYYIYL